MKKTIALLATLAGLLIPSLASPPAAADITAANGNALWSCTYSHTATEDPIKFPGQSPAGHSHDFAGASTTGASSTWDSIVTSPTTCNIPADHSGYWVPTLIAADGVTQVHFTSIGVYWRGNGADPLFLQPFADNLQEIQGSATNTSPNSYSETYRCDNQNTTSIYIPSSCGGAGIEASIYFPVCASGGPVASDFHPLGTCGTGFPITVPSLQLLIEYPPAAAGGALSSDYQITGGLTRPGLTGHADWWNGLDPSVALLINQKCLDTTAVQCRVDPATGNLVDFAAPGSPKPVVIPAGQLAGF